MPTPPSSTTNSNSDSASQTLLLQPSSILPSPSPAFPLPYSLQIYTDSSSTIGESKLPPSLSVLKAPLNVGRCTLFIMGACASVMHSRQLGGIKSGAEERRTDSNPCFAKVPASLTLMNISECQPPRL